MKYYYSGTWNKFWYWGQINTLRPKIAAYQRRVSSYSTVNDTEKQNTGEWLNTNYECVSFSSWNTQCQAIVTFPSVDAYLHVILRILNPTCANTPNRQTSGRAANLLPWEGNEPILRLPPFKFSSLVLPITQKPPRIFKLVSAPTILGLGSLYRPHTSSDH